MTCHTKLTKRTHVVYFGSNLALLTFLLQGAKKSTFFGRGWKNFQFTFKHICAVNVFGGHFSRRRLMGKFNHLTNFLFSTSYVQCPKTKQTFIKKWISLNFYFDRFLAFTISQILILLDLKEWHLQIYQFLGTKFSLFSKIGCSKLQKFLLLQIFGHQTQPDFHFAEFAKVKFAILPIFEMSNSQFLSKLDVQNCQNLSLKIGLFRFRPL